MEEENSCISKKEILEIQDKQVVLIDVRSKIEFDTQHIPNALHIPVEQIDNALTDFSKDKLYVTACGNGGGRSMEASLKLKQNGMDSFWLCGGTFGWLN